MDDGEHTKRTYEVGYGKPPKHTQWKENESGNIRGRPPGAKNNKKRIKRMLDEPQPVKIGDKVRSLSTFELSLQRISEGVRKGDKTAVARAISLGLELDKHEEAKAHASPAVPAVEPLSEEDKAILLDYLARQKALKEAF
jgi:hypothetical protein